MSYGLFFMATPHGYISMAKYMKNEILDAFAPLTRCKSNMDQEE